ncbi:hypothetical protein PG1C_04115 [Rugosibacter aromaticivorans]|uniref:Uncharacterized protein n=1 Tax=Rugosibacter aromaticivorans TaxID=1565605 RepID=A0A0C5IYP2_9PROT|nr:hypothetical protein [Rugosibacter aromaticivorans]AJP47872.1 hypothetical protein PG1C_04115 [Rugosibacter aromaticivorans]
MVSVEKENAFQLREYLHGKVVDSAGSDPFKSCFLSFLGLTQAQPASFDLATLSLYQKCAIAGLHLLDASVSTQELSRLLGQAAKIDSTPRPWVSDVFGTMALKWLVEQTNNEDVQSQFKTWSGGFIPQQLSSNRFNIYEKDIAAYIGDSEAEVFSSACIPLFLHYHGIQLIVDHQKRLSLIDKFMEEFRQQATVDSSTALLSLMIYVFDMVNKDIVLVPPNGWTLTDLVRFLEHIPIGLKRWTWESSGRTKGADPVKWPIMNEYHVQNLLYVLLAPIFEDIADEIYLQPIGQKTPRVDLYLPSVHTIIEVKYRKDMKKSFPALIGEVAEDVSLYRSDPKYKDARIISFLWDHTRSTQEHAKFREGLLKIQGMDGCVVLSSPSTME